MSSLPAFLVVYILGGLTFLPVVLGVLFLHAYYTFPDVAAEEPTQAALQRDDDGDDVFKTGDEKLVRRLANSVDVAAGTFAVTREFVPGGVNGKPPERTSPAGTSPVNSGDSPSVYQSMYRSLFDRRTASASRSESANGGPPPKKRAKNEFFVVLRHGYLMLYDDADQTDVRHVIALNQYKVDIYGGGEKIPEGALYIRRNAIRLYRDTPATDPTIDDIAGHMPFFLFSDNCSLKEDFYLALLKYQDRDPNDPSVPPTPLRYDQEDMIRLVQRLHSSEDHLQMNWINGLLGRIFLAVYKTPEIEGFIRAKIVKKISRVNKPNFLSDIKVQDIHVGNGAPEITNPRLKEMTADGDFCVEADVNYAGNFRLTIATKATMNLGARFKPREVNLVLAVILKRLDGHAFLKLKPPPSNRLWFCFESMPKMELVIEPVVGSRQVAWGPILRIIEGRIREVIAETVVFPQYDDIPFTDTSSQRFRGGIWDEKKRKRRRPPPPPPPPTFLEKEVQEDTEVELDQSKGARTPEFPLPEKSFSTTMLADSHLNMASKKAASAIGLTSAEEEEEEEEEELQVSKSPKSPSIKSSSSGKGKAHRTHSLNSVCPPAPLVGTDTINVTALRGQSESETGDAAAAVMAIRARSSSNPQSSPMALQGPPPKAHTFSNDATPVPSGNRGEESPRPASIREIDEHTDSSSSAPTSTLSATPVGSISGGSSYSFGSNIAPISRSSTGSSKSLADKPSIAALTTAAASVKKWYKNRNSSASVEQNSQSTTTRPLPPNTIPPPPAKKTAPINVPKRKPLPPPLVPPRRNRNGLAPPLPPRHSSGGDTLHGEDQVFVVAAPDSEPSTPSGEDVSFEGGSAEEGTSIDSSDSPRRARDQAGSWERASMRERAQEESETWHAAEEAELRTRLPWEPDEL